MADSTLLGISDRLKHLARHSNLDDPEDVKRFIAAKEVENSYKHDLAKAYNYYVLIKDHKQTATIWIPKDNPRPKYRKRKH